jgi:hypothetical protein
MSWLRDLLRSPSDFRRDPWGYLRNQLGHAYLVGAGLILAGLPLWLVLAGYACWEALQFARYGAEPHDGIEDLAHVAAGAAIVATGSWLFLPVHALFLGAGFLWRKSERERWL